MKKNDECKVIIKSDYSLRWLSKKEFKVGGGVAKIKMYFSLSFVVKNY